MLWGSHPEKKSCTCLTSCTVSSHWRQLALLSCYVSLCGIAGWQKRATFTSCPHGFCKHEKRKQNCRALAHIRVAGGSHRSCAFVPRQGHSHHSCGSASAACYHAELSLLLVFIDTWGTLYQWLPANEIAFLQGSPKPVQPLDPAGARFCASLELLSFGPSKHNLFVLCPWAIFSKPVSTLVWTVIGANHS